MTKVLIGVAIGYLLSDVIDELLGKNAPAKPTVDTFTQEEPPPPSIDDEVG